MCVAQAANMYIVGEVDSSDIQMVSSYQGSLDATLSYPMFFTLRDVFANKVREISHVLQSSPSDSAEHLGVFHFNVWGME